MENLDIDCHESIFSWRPKILNISILRTFGDFHRLLVYPLPGTTAVIIAIILELALHGFISRPWGENQLLSVIFMTILITNIFSFLNILKLSMHKCISHC